MKKILLYVTILLISLNFIGCSDSAFSDLYVDPSKTTEVTCGKLMTGVFYGSLQYTKPTYYRYYTFDIMTTSRYTQTIGAINGDGMYQPNDGYISARWNNFYRSLTQLRLLEYTYDRLDDSKKAENEIFLLASRVFVYGQLQEILDLWGDVPFKGAGLLPITGDIKISRAAYDKAEDLYKLILDDLATINTRLGELDGKLSVLAAASFGNQDYINKGNVLKWRKYANSLRLRVAMRVASQGSLANTGRAVLKEMLETNMVTYPVVSNNDEMIRINADKDGFNPLLDEDGSQGIKSAFETGSSTGVLNRVPKSMLDRMYPNDPRIPVLFTPNSKGEYTGLNPLDDSDTQRRGLEATPNNLYASLDSATINRNDNLPGVLFTAAEVSFIKAEAFNEGYASGNAQTAFEQAVIQSINFYYNLNNSSTFADPVSRPLDSEIASFATSKWTGDHKEAIATQKWLNFGCLYTAEAWSELRRTQLPRLQFLEDRTSIDCPTPVYRFRYPADERNNNKANYKAVEEADQYYNKLFWAK